MYLASAPADDAGIAVLAAGVRTWLQMRGGNGEGAGLVTHLLAADARTRLRKGVEENILRLEVEERGTELIVVLRDKGEPVTAPPQGILPLLDLGIATAADARTDGEGNVTEVRFALPGHHEIFDPETIVEGEDDDLSSEEVMIRVLVSEDAAALTRTIYRCYGWTYPVQDLYFPERIAAAIKNGSRIGEVAVTESGEIAAHWGAVHLSSTVVETGGTVTDPRFRRRGLAKQLGDRLLERILEAGITGRLREPVLTHPATQQIALNDGATIVGAYLRFTHPLQQVGITDGIVAHRNSLSVAYGPLQPLEPATVWVPQPYEHLASMVLAQSNWPREFGTAYRGIHIPDVTVSAVNYDAGNRLGIIDVATVGQNLIDYLDSSIDDLRRSGAEHIQVRLPANQPALHSLGAGLPEIGLAFGALIPQLRTFEPGEADCGDVLIVQWLADADLDTDSWVFATEQVSAIVLAIAEQVQQVANSGQLRRRQAARRAQLFAALD
jgi:GNAT superfamily N-acetyltransferase